MPRNSMDESALTIKDLATYLKMNKRTVYRLTAAKKLPAFKVGDTWHFMKADIDRWIKSQTFAVDDLGEGAHE